MRKETTAMAARNKESASVNFSEVEVPESAQKPEPTLDDLHVMLSLCKQAEGSFQSWGTAAKARLTRRFKSHGVTVNWND